MITRSLFSLTLALFFLAGIVSAAPGTTPGLDVIFQGKCIQSMLSNANAPVLCAGYWETFRSIILSKNPLNFTAADWEPFFTKINTQFIPNRSTFWSGANELAHKLTMINRNYITLEDTFPSVALNGFKFCPLDSIASPSDQSLSANSGNPLDGFDMESCPEQAKVNGAFVDAVGTYWEAASLYFAKGSSGDVSVIFNAVPGRTCYRKNSYFGGVEIPNMDTTAVNSIRVMVLTNSSNPTERCGQGSFIELESDIRQHFMSNKDFVYKCQDDPMELLFVSCTTSTSSRCMRLAQPPTPSTPVPSPQNSKFTRILVVSVGFGCLFVGILVTALVPFFVKSCRKRQFDRV